MSFEEGTQITTIPYNAFAACRNLQNVTLPNNLLTIEEQAFAQCGFSNIILPSKLNSIGRVAFGACSSLTNITIPISVSKMLDGAFCNNNNLNEIHLNWNSSAQLDTLFFNSFDPQQSPNVHLWGIFGFFKGKTNDTFIDNDNPNLKVFLPKEISHETYLKYRQYFGPIEIKENTAKYAGLKLRDDQWIIGDLPSSNSLPAILGGVFGSIAAIGLIAGGITIYKKKK
ncbi:MAG: leucine-rich repeat protein [Mycoplasma sp.]